MVKDYFGKTKKWMKQLQLHKKLPIQQKYFFFVGAFISRTTTV